MAGKQVVAELEAVLKVRGFKETEEAMRRTKREVGGVASGLKGLNDTMARAGSGTKKSGAEVKAFGVKTSKLNQLVQQASFGLQDFAIVIGQGGLGMALRSASNNAAQMGAIMGGIGGAVAGLGVTLLALIPDLLTMFSGAESGARRAEAAIGRMTERVRRLNEELNKVRTRIDIEIAIKRAQRGNAKQQSQAAEDFGLRADREQRLLGEKQKVRMEFLRKELQVALDNSPALKQLAKVFSPTKDLNLSKLVGKLDAERGAPLKVDAIIAKALGPVFTKQIEDELAKKRKGKEFDKSGARDFFEKLAQVEAGRLGLKGGDAVRFMKDFMKNLDDMSDKIRKAKFQIEVLRKAQKILAESAKIKGKEEKVVAAVKADEDLDKKRQKTTKEVQRSIDKANKAALQKRIRDTEATARGAAFAEREKKSADQSRLKSLQNEKKALQGILEVTDPTAAGLQKLKEKFDKFAADTALAAFVRADDPIQGAFDARDAASRAQAAGAKARKSFLSKQQPGISGTFGVADFSRQLQNSLLKSSDQQKIANSTGQTAKNTKTLINKIEANTKAVEKIKVGLKA